MSTGERRGLTRTHHRLNHLYLSNRGFYNCLSENGEVYDTLKHCWMQGRQVEHPARGTLQRQHSSLPHQVWMYAKLYNSLPSFHTDEVLQAAERGGQFLISHVRVPGQARCYFAVSADGQPARLQRKPYTESFYTIAMSELYRATGKKEYRVREGGRGREGGREREGEWGLHEFAILHRCRQRRYWLS